jgi:hypothetical protein
MQAFLFRFAKCYPVKRGGPLLRHQPNCMNPQIAIRAEITRAAHDTFIDTLCGPICTARPKTFPADKSPNVWFGSSRHF